MDASERALFAGAIQRATAEHRGADLDAALDGLGWADALAEDRSTAVAVLFEALGEANATSSALDQVLSAALGGSDLAAAAVVLPPLGAVGPPGRLEGARLAVHGLGTEALVRRAAAIVVAAGEGGDELFVVSVGGAQGGTRLGPGRRASGSSWSPVRSTTVPLSRSTGAPRWPPGSSPSATSSSEPVGPCSKWRGSTRSNGSNSVSRLPRFKRCGTGWPRASSHSRRRPPCSPRLPTSRSPVHAAMAKAFAGRSARTVARHCQQVLAGIGFTTEHGLHRFVRRTYLLDQLLGAGSVLTRQLGAEVLAARSLPASFPL